MDPITGILPAVNGKRQMSFTVSTISDVICLLYNIVPITAIIPFLPDDYPIGYIIKGY